MIIFNSLADIPADFGPSIATIGNFDGVHRGHQWVIAEVVAQAHAQNLRSIAITFDPHPARVIRPESSQPLITPLAQKLELLAATGIDAVLVLPFTSELSRMTARTFATEVLQRALHVTQLHEGENFRFGYQAEAGIENLEALGRELGFTVRVYAPRHLRGETISSSRIRQMIAEGDVTHVRTLLGRSFAICGTPASGRGYGTRYTVPTINLAPYAELLPANGVYITSLTVGAGASSETFDGVTNVGNRPTFGADSFTVETHLLNFHPIELNESTSLVLTFLRRLRDEMRWPNPEALKEQIGRDVAKAKRYFNICRVVDSKLHSAHPQA
ncbi:bifunctional riboflavin kinase/FAD synthetase [Tunturibacter empetritectus]|uniref:Riboflavin biosynthesis protein n=1 Tax=Tunturiibacter empetritectus TaxID=3069691 RepID=A0A7W8MST1_9BACT|nr:bifunctional riboflavin kinase/FAD synthetase [Edaphobacter lichenicola]MBB5319018.1 riboflavin kinase/FMN adenylyltransferase [Edaphobacter lichenicola]